MFSLNHILFMLGTFLSTYYISNWLKDKSVDFVDKYMKFFTVVVLAFDPIYWIWEWNTYGGGDLSTTLPLYICSLFWIMLPLAVFSKNEALKRSAMSNICSVGFLGGVFGLVFNTHLNYHPFFSFVPMRSLLLLQWIKETSAKTELTLSVCTGSLILGQLGILDNLVATTHHECIDLLKELAPKTKVKSDERFIDNGKVLVAAGISAGIDMSLYVVEKLLGKKQALETANYMEYPYLSSK